MKLTKRTLYEVEINSQKYTLEFLAEKKLPGFSHKVIITKDNALVAKDWLGNHVNPTQKNALFFLEKHLSNV